MRETTPNFPVIRGGFWLGCPLGWTSRTTKRLYGQEDTGMFWVFGEGNRERARVSWVIHLGFLSLDFLAYKIDLIIPVSQGGCENKGF